MVSASYYHNLYLFVVTLMLLYSMSLYNRWGKLYNVKDTSRIVAFLLLVFVIYFIGTRPIDGIFVDMVGYSSGYELFFGDHFFFEWDTENLIWDNLFTWMASVKVQPISG